MSLRDDLITDIERDLASRVVPPSVEDVFERINPLSIGLERTSLSLPVETRLFRIRKMERRPEIVSEVGAPPPGLAPLGRLNEFGQSVLYLADSPDTAFAEVGASTGQFCLSEWRTTPAKLGLANGGLTPDILAAARPDHPNDAFPRGVVDEQVHHLFRTIFALPVTGSVSLYRWSIACGLVNGFAHVCERQATEKISGNTKWTGRYPFSGIAYPSVRSNLQSINYAFNDLGFQHLRLDHVQWVERHGDGSFSGIDYACSWDWQGAIKWQNRPAHPQLRQGERAQLVKTAENILTYETSDGSIPWFV